MRQFWTKFRDRAARKEERAHFGLAWSVFAGSFFAGALVVRSFHGAGHFVTVLKWVACAFVVLGFSCAYLALAVAMRWPPHNPKKRDVVLCDKTEALFLEGHNVLQSWEAAVAPLSMGPARDQWMNAHMQIALDWVKEADESVKDLLGEEEGFRFKMSPNLKVQPPEFARSGAAFDHWQGVRGRIDWIREWMQEQGNL